MIIKDIENQMENISINLDHLKTIYLETQNRHKFFYNLIAEKTMELVSIDESV